MDKSILIRLNLKDKDKKKKDVSPLEIEHIYTYIQYSTINFIKREEGFI
jgi:hypothetical protein